MIFIDKMKNFKIYRTKTFLPTVNGDKKKGSAILLMTPNYESSRKLMNSELFVNSRRFSGYYLEKDVSYYIDKKHIEEVEESSIIQEQIELQSCLETKRSDLKDEDFGIPSLRKYPLDTEKHVRSAIKFFNYVDSEHEEELAENIISAIKKFGIDDIKYSERNRFFQYYKDFIKESIDGIPKYHTMYGQLDLIYSMWQNGTISEDRARETIFAMRGRNLANKEEETPDDVPTPEEYFSNKGSLETNLKKYIAESTEAVDYILERKNDKGEEVPEICPVCGNKVGVFIKGEPVFLCTKKDCAKFFGVVPFTEQETMKTEDFMKYIHESTLNTGDKIMFVNEATNNNSQMKRILYSSRLRYRKDVLMLLDTVKKDNPFIQYAFPEIEKYQKKNIFVDLYYYNSVFFQNNTWTLKKGFNLYLDFVERLINHPNLKKSGYNTKTIFIPVKDWDKLRNGSVWNYKQSLNPISCIYQLMFTNAVTQLKNTFGKLNIIFVGDNEYFKINFSEIDAKEIKKLSVKLRLFVTKICMNEEFSDEDVDTSADVKEDPEVISAKLVDKIENVKGIDLTAKVANAIEIKKQCVGDDKDSIKKANELKKNRKNSMTGQSDSLSSQKVTQTINKQNIIADDEIEDTTEEEAEDVRKAKELERLAQAVADASETAEDEEDAMDKLDQDEIKRILADLGTDDEVNISAARSSRMSELDKKLLDKSVKGKTVKEILEDESDKKEEKTTVDVASPNKEEWKDLSYINFDKNYNIDKDIINIFRFFNNCTRPIVVRDLKVEDTSTSEDRVMTYDVDMEDYRGKRYRIKLDIPIMEDNRFLLRGNSKSIQTQFFNMPIIKTDLGTCQLISNYNKIFLYRFNDSAGRTLPAVSKLLKAAKKYTGRKIKFITGNNTKVCAKYNLPVDYIDLAGSLSRIETEDWIVYFNQDELRKKYKVESGKGFPFAYNKKLDAVEYFPPDIVDTFVNMLCLNIFKVDEEFKKLFDVQTRPRVSAYSRASIMSEKIPLILICAYYIGLEPVMKRAGINYEIVKDLSKEIKNDVNKDWIEFNDGYIVYDLNYETGLLMNGLKVCNTEMYNINEINNKGMYTEFMDDYGGRMKLDGLDNFYNLFVDPMIKESLEYYNLPTNFIDILLYGNSMLNDNKYIKHTDTSSRRLRRYQLISVYAYKALADAYAVYSNQLKHAMKFASFSVKQSAVIDAFLSDTITSDDSCINALRDVETTNSITTKGPSGMNADRAYSLDKRSYNDSMLNVLGMSTGFAGNVGITRQSTMNANITAEGYVKQSKKENMNDANTLTATEAMIPFGSTHDDPMRTAMSFIQTSKHMVRTEDSDPLLVTNGSDEVMPYMTTDKFAFKAKKDGIIKEYVQDEYMLVEYIDGTKDYINLSETTEKNSDGGYFVPLKLDAMDGAKVNLKFKKDCILAYDKYSFSNKLGESNNLAYNIGKLAKIAILNTDEGFEDSGIISDSMAKKLATRIIVKFAAVVDKDSKVFSIGKIGDHVEASDTILMWETAVDDEDASELMDALTDGDISDIGKRKLKSEVTGTLVDIKMFRTIEYDDMSESLRKIVEDYERPIKKRAKIIKDNGLSMSKVPAHYALPPTGKLKRAQEAVLIEFYVEYLDTVGVGDKIVYNSANKAVEKNIFPIGQEPYTEFRPNEKIDAFVGDSSISKRLVTSTFIYGSLQKLMIELDRSVKDIMGIPWDDTTV